MCMEWWDVSQRYRNNRFAIAQYTHKKRGTHIVFPFLICVICKSKAILILIKLICKYKYLSYLKLFMVECVCLRFSFDMRHFVLDTSLCRCCCCYCCYYYACVWLLLLWCSFDIHGLDAYSFRCSSRDFFPYFSWYFLFDIIHPV